MARVLIDGFELGLSGDLTPGWSSVTATAPVQETTIVKSGAYAMKVAHGTSSFFSKTGLNNSALYCKLWFYVDVDTNPSIARAIFPIKLLTGAGASIASVEVLISTGGICTLRVQNHIASTTPISGIAFSKDTWHCIEFKCTINATTGILEVKLDGATTTASSQNTGSTNIGQVQMGAGNVPGAGGSGTCYFDDLVIDDAAHCGQSKIICRQPNATTAWTGSGTWNGWDHSTGTNMYALWDETPVDESTFGTSNGNQHAASVANFSSTQTGHGSDTVGSSDTINIAQVITKAKRSGGGGRTHELVHGDGSTDPNANHALGNFWTLSLTTSPLYYKSPLFTNLADTLTLLDAAQVGGAKSGGGGGQEMTFYDMWMMVEYTPASGTTTTQDIDGQSRIQKVQPRTILGKSAIRNTTTRTTDGRSRLQKVVQATVQGLSRLQKVVAATLGARAAIQNTTPRTIDGRSRLQKAALQTTAGRSRVQKVQAPTIDGRTRIQNTTNQTSQGRGRVQKAFEQTIGGLAAIVATVLQTVQGLARITATTLRTIQAVARIQGTTAQALDGRSRLTKSALQTTQGRSRIQDVVAATLNGLSRITATLSQTIQARSRIQDTTSQTIQGLGRILISVIATLNALSRITKQQAQTIQAQARVQKVQSATVQGLARIYKTITQTIQGIAKIAGATTQTIQAVARLLKSQSQATQGRARLQKQFNQTTLGQSRIGNIVLATLTGVSRIYKTLTQTVQGRSRILRTFTATINGTARVLKSVTATIQGVAQIIHVTAQVLNGRSRIQLVVTETIEGKANIYATLQKNILGRSKITVGATEHEIPARARLIRVRQTDVFGQTRVQKAAEQSIQARSKIATFGPGVGSTNKISFDMTTVPVQLDPNVDSIRVNANSRPVELKMQ